MSELPALSDRVRRPEQTAAATASQPFAGNAATSRDTVALAEKLAWQQFVWEDRQPRVVAAVDTDTAPVAAGDRPASKPDDLPRIISAPLVASAGSPPDSHEEWRRQFISALKDVDDNAPIPAPAATSRPPAVFAPRTDRSRNEASRRLAEAIHAEPRETTTPRLIGRAVAGGAVAIGLFSTGVLWATYRTESGPALDTRPTQIAATMQKIDAPSGTPPTAQPMVNTPVLVREGETAPPAPLPDTSAWRRPPAATPVPPAPRPEVSAPVPPLIINRTVTVHAVPPPGVAAPVRSDAPSVEVSPPLDRASLTELAARPVPLPAPPPAQTPPPAAAPQTERHIVRRPEPGPAAPARRHPSVTAEAYQSRASATHQTSRAKWETRRQGLRTAPPRPEPEPSTFKKLLNAVWPGSPATTASATKPAAPAAAASSVAAPAPPAATQNWTSASSPGP